MAPGPLFKRRHYGTPQSMLLIISNFVVFAVVITLCGKNTGWFFWTCIVLLALYNFFNIRKDHESYDKARTAVYICSLVVLIALYIIFRLKA
jgi:hypothetical protein